MIKQAIIPLAGLGTRLLPLTSVFPKELLPINGKPGIEYILDECIEAGVSEIIFIISKKKEMIKKYFNNDNFYKSIIKKKKDPRIIKEYKKILRYKKMIKSISYSDTWLIRHQVMWPDKPLKFVELENDSSGIHFGYYVNQSLVAVVSLFIDKSKEKKCNILPVDSEHSAIFQCLENDNISYVDSITLTASGGPFLNEPIENFKNIKPEDAIKAAVEDYKKKSGTGSST